MPTLDWLNRAAAFTTAAKVPYRLLEQVSVHTSSPNIAISAAINATNLIAIQAINTLARCQFLPIYCILSLFLHASTNLANLAALVSALLTVVTLCSICFL